jgi:hypothetical protein
MTIFGSDAHEIEVRGLGRSIASNGRAGVDHEYLCFADGLNGRRYIVLVNADSRIGLATVEGMPGRVNMLPEVEFTILDGFPAYDPDKQYPQDWLQSLI